MIKTYNEQDQARIINLGWRPYHDNDLNTDFAIPPVVPIEIVAHPLAPHFSNREEGLQTLIDLAADLQSPNFQFTEESLGLIREACLVSLFFFLKFVAGAYGPYADLTDHLHVDVCNFRQRQLQAGARAAVFLPRSMYKSTVCTHGAITWELLRDPNLRVGLCASNSEMAEQFMLPVKMNFEDNPLIAHLFPAYVPAKGTTGTVIEKGWASGRITLPNRTISMPEPSVKCLGAGGSVAGNHFDLLSVDDLVSEKELDSDRGASADMQKKGQWFSSNQDTLLITPKKSRVFLAATRYSTADPYEDMFQEVHQAYGYWDELPYNINTDTGIWDIYYRMALEQDNPIFPEKVGNKELARMQKKDPWKYYTQYLNNPYAAQVSEFSSYAPKKCIVDYDNFDGYKILITGGPTEEVIPLSECEVTLGLDPAASETKKSNRTSQSALVVQAKDCQNRHFYIDGAVGYFSPTQMFDHLFRLYNKWRPYVSNAHIEAHGGFKIVWNSLIEEQRRRQTFMGVRRIRPLPDKDSKLRSFLQPLLEFGKLYVADPIADKIMEELTVFPGGVKRDMLDAMEIADRDTPIPENPHDMNKRAWNNVTGHKGRAGY